MALWQALVAPGLRLPWQQLVAGGVAKEWDQAAATATDPPAEAAALPLHRPLACQSMPESWPQRSMRSEVYACCGAACQQSLAPR